MHLKSRIDTFKNSWTEQYKLDMVISQSDFRQEDVVHGRVKNCLLHLVLESQYLCKDCYFCKVDQENIFS